MLPVITDLGITRIMDTKMLLVEGFTMAELRGASVTYAAPEVWIRLRMKSYIEKNVNVWKAGDVFAVIVCMLEMHVRNRF